MPPPLSTSIDLPALRESLPQLIEAYARARSSVQSWRAFTTLAESRPVVQMPSQSNDRPLTLPRRLVSLGRGHFTAMSVLGWAIGPLDRWWYGFAIKPVVLFWMDSHVAGKARRVQAVLRRHRVSHATEMSADMRAVDDLLLMLGYTASVAPAYERIIVLLRFVPVLGLLITIGFVPLSVDVRSASLGELFNETLVILGQLPLVVILLNPLIVRFGYRWKRAVFSGGVVERRDRTDTTARYAGLEGPNLYALEDLVFRHLGVRKRTDLPVDLILSPAVYFALNYAVSLGVGLAALAVGSGEIRGGIARIVAVAAVAAVGLLLVRQLYKRHQRRRALGLL